MPKKNDTLIIVTYDYDMYRDSKMEQVLGAIMSPALNQALPPQKPALRYRPRRWGEKPVQDGAGFPYVHNTVPPSKWDYFGHRVLRQAIRAAYNGSWKPNKTQAEKIAEFKYYALLVTVVGVMLTALFVFILPNPEPEIPPQPTYQGLPDEIPRNAPTPPPAQPDSPPPESETATQGDVPVPQSAHKEPNARMDDETAAPAPASPSAPSAISGGAEAGRTAREVVEGLQILQHGGETPGNG